MYLTNSQDANTQWMFFPMFSFRAGCYDFVDVPRIHQNIDVLVFTTVDFLSVEIASVTRVCWNDFHIDSSTLEA